MGEFSDDDDFASFDLDAAVAAAPSLPAMAKENHPNVGPSGTGPAKRPASSSGEGNKRFKTEENSNENGEDAPNMASGEDLDAAVPAPFHSAMTEALQSHFGHSGFRPGQLAVLHSLLGQGEGGGKDTCVFWATGAGKSLCYQLPPLHLNQVTLVVSPLISLMEDQVAKLNGRSGANVATFLGSSQSDPTAESRALNGEFRLIYVTPEKLTGGGFLDGLASMHQRGGSGRVCLVAVDESHCVSEWGHEFRPSFLGIGPALREHPILAPIPILALTATAVPRVQRDIATNLRMQPDATMVKKSFDRTNLKITIRRKPRNGHHGAFDGLAGEMAKAILKQGNASGKSTIVYCSTKKEVEEVASRIAQALAHQLVQQHASSGNGDKALSFDTAGQMAAKFVKPYHAGLSFGARSDAHTEFLIGKVTVIVATVAFGMGIDKPDIRRVIHWGACKTVEEYYQQMGRAGRDGLSAECTMYCDANDFAKYHSDFYIGGLQGEVRAATIRSMDALRDFAMSSDGCRRAALLEFFDETPAFGKFCGTCDLCLNRKDHGDDSERDFQNEGARVILYAIQACPNQAMSAVQKVIGGGDVEKWRYRRDLQRDPSAVSRKIKSLKEKMSRKKPIDYYKELLPSLVGGKYVVTSMVKNDAHQYARPYAVYNLSPKGEAAATSGSIILPVPASVREQDRLEEERKQRTLDALKGKGVDLDDIPQEERETGEGEAIAALQRWYSYVDSLTARGSIDRVNQLDDLKLRIEAWRMDMAERFRMAPASVMESHLLVKIAYACASMRTGKMDKEALIAAGVRSNGIDELTTVLGQWADETNNNADDGANSNADDSPMSFTAGEVTSPSAPWTFAVYKPQKKTGKATWEVSYDKFVSGTHPQTIAMTQKSGKPIQVATVVGHILEALVQGRPVDLGRLAAADPPPNRAQWDELVRCSVETGLDVTGDPATSGPNSERFAMKDFLVPIMGNAFSQKDFKDRTPEESAKWSKWCTCLKWYLALRRVGVEPTFGGGP